MANTYKVLGQANPSTTANTNIYTVPSGTSTVISTLHVANVVSGEVTCRIYVRIGGATAAAANAIAFDVKVATQSIFAITTGMTLGPGDIVTVSCNTANALTFTLFGSEVN